jgi:hypothetical protein
VLSARARIATSLFVVALPLAGCDDLGDPATAQAVTRNDLIAEVAAQLTGSAALTYTATYQLTGGAAGTIAHAPTPERMAYRYPGGSVTLTPSATTRCVRAACTMTKPEQSETAVRTAQRAGLVPPPTVLALLNAAALDTDLTVDQHDTTIAGRHATCLDLDGVDNAATSAFATCITNDGVVGSFTGTLDGKAIDVAMTNYADRAQADAFDPPAGATMTDRR